MGRKSKADVRKKEILSHFYEVLTQEGFEGASIAKIAKSMDVNPSLLIHYFSTKEDMVIELVESILSTYRTGIFPSLQNIDDPAERFDQLLNYTFGTDWNGVIDDSVFFDSFALSLRNQDISHRFKKVYNELREAMLSELKHALAHNVIKIEDPEKALDMLFVMMEGAHMFNRLRDDSRPMWERGEFLKSNFLFLIKGNQL
ncbi:MAG: TetR/AcrR family transcriptional regulator [Bacteroidota bacterium]